MPYAVNLQLCRCHIGANRTLSESIVWIWNNAKACPAVIEGNEGRLLVHSTASLEADLADNAMYVW